MLPPVAEKRRVPVLTLLLVYLGIFIAASIFAIIVLMVMDQFFTSNSRNSSMGFLIPMITAMAMTQFWAKREGIPSKKRRWLIALYCGILTLALGLAQLWLLVQMDLLPELSRDLSRFSREDLTIALIIFPILLLLLVLVIRGGFGLGFSGLEKQQKKLAAKLNKRT